MEAVPERRNLPALQTLVDVTHDDRDVPAPELEVLGGHRVQAALPTVSLYEEAAQAVQEVAPFPV